MTKLHLVMPMGGGGTRFGKSGYNLPKPMIDLQGNPFFYWAVQSIVHFMEVEDITFVVLQEHIDSFAIDKKIKEYYPKAKLYVLPRILNGAVLTCQEGVSMIQDNLPILFNDCDHAFVCHAFYNFAKQADFSGVDGALLTFESDSPNFSYVKFDNEKKITGTIEKVVVSNEAICGAYYFNNKITFNNAVETYLNKCQYKEYFMSGVYNELAAKNYNIRTFKVDAHISFGTPAEYEMAMKNEHLKELL